MSLVISRVNGGIRLHQPVFPSSPVNGQIFTDPDTNVQWFYQSSRGTWGFNDPFRSSTALHLRGDGANNSTTITDSSPVPKTVTANGGAKISTAQSKFGGSSIAFDGAGDYVSAPSTAMISGTGDFTIEWWQKLTSSVETYSTVRFSTHNTFSGIRTSYGSFQFYLEAALSININAIANFTTEWQHCAICRSSGIIRLFLDGSSLTLSTNGNPAASVPSTVLDIGRAWTKYSYNDFNGYIDEFRVTTTARYTANFTPPTAAFPDF